MKYCILISFFIILSACEDRPDIPEFSEIDSAEQILEQGPRAYAAQRASWQEYVDQNEGHTALMTQRLVSFCRRVNQAKFRGGACRS
jgi:hypothetical protein